MSNPIPRPARLDLLYDMYQSDHDSAGFIRQVSLHYTLGTLERLAEHGHRVTRRAAVLALGLMADYGSNAVLGRALVDEDRGVRILADNAMRSIWCRCGNEAQRRQLGLVVRLNTSQQFGDAVVAASDLIAQAPWFAEAWNQRAIAHYSCGRYSESIRDCQQALEINPYHFGAAAGMGQCFLQIGNQASALESFRRALRLNPDLEGVRANVTQLERANRRRP